MLALQRYFSDGHETYLVFLVFFVVSSLVNQLFFKYIFPTFKSKNIFVFTIQSSHSIPPTTMAQDPDQAQPGAESQANDVPMAPQSTSHDIDIAVAHDLQMKDGIDHRIDAYSISR